MSETRYTLNESQADYNIAEGHNPFFDLSALYFPNDVKESFKMARVIYYTNGLVRQAIKKLAEYAITNLEYSASDDKDSGLSETEIEMLYKEIFEDTMEIKRFLIGVGLDYFVYGNAFTTIYFPFERRLTCPHCSETHKDKNPETLPEARVDEHTFPIRDIADWKYTGCKYKGTCPSCNRKVEFRAQDHVSQSQRDIKLIRWNPEHISIKYYPFTGEREYALDPAAYSGDSIKNGENDFIARTPSVVLDCIAKDKTVILNSRDIYHFMSEGPTDDQQQWGKAIIICAFKNIFYTAILRKGAQAIATDQIVPLRVLFPQIQGSEGIAAGAIKMRTYEAAIRREYEDWRKDPNHIMISPIPIGMQFLGGQGRSLLPTPEIQQATEEVFLSLGIPQGVILGNAHWAGNSIAMRMIENAFLNYRDQIHAVLSFIQTRIRDYLNLPACEVKMREFKMLDDVQYKQLMLNMAASKMISKERVLDMFDIPYEKEQKDIEKELADEAKMHAHAQAEAMRIQNTLQREFEADLRNAMVQDQLNATSAMTTDLIDKVNSLVTQGWPIDSAIQAVMNMQMQNQMMMQMQMQTQQADQARQLFLQDRMASTAWSLARAQRQLQMFDTINQGQPAPQRNQFQTEVQYVNNLVNYLMQLPEEQRQSQLESLQQQDIAMYERVINYLNAIGGMPALPQPGGQQGPGGEINPLPQQGAPRRTSL